VPKLPENWKAHLTETRALITGFIQSRPQFLMAYPEDEAQAGKAWPSPRSWDLAAHLLAAVKAARADEDCSLELVSGAVGEGVTIEYMTWQRELDLPDPEELLKDPKKFKLPKRGDQTFAVLGSVVSAAVANLTAERWLAAWEVLSKAAKDGAVDIGAAAAKSLVQAKRGDLPLPVEQIKPFVPILKASGLMA
jgi:hypothetical protein